jgi:hypothetical protein
MILASLLVASLAAGCGKTMSLLKREPTPESGSMEPSEKAKIQIGMFPYQLVWCASIDWSKFSEIKIAPVNTDFLMEMDWWYEMNEPFINQRVEDVKRIAEYMENSFKRTVQNDPNKRFELTETEGPNTLVLELALIEIIPTDAFFNAPSTVAELLTPDATLSTVSSKGSVAMEGRTRDSETDGIVSMFADRKHSSAGSVSVTDITWYGHAELIIDEWSDQFIKMFNTKVYLEVQNNLPFMLKPW